MTNIKNLTPHNIVVIVNDDIRYVITTSDSVARCSSSTEVIGEVNGIPITRTIYGEIVGLPDPKENTIYIVSTLVAQACPNRDDLFIPNEVVRDDSGKVIGCKSFGRVH
jgi:hypothetical protein